MRKLWNFPFGVIGIDIDIGQSFLFV